MIKYTPLHQIKCLFSSLLWNLGGTEQSKFFSWVSTLVIKRKCSFVQISTILDLNDSKTLFAFYYSALSVELTSLVMSPSWNFLARAEPSWGTLIFELKPSWTEIFLTHFLPKFLIFQSILWSFIWTFVFLKVNNLIQMHNLVNFLIKDNRK